jgi:tetratricopeptide (TPR) repeat protein
VGAILIKFAKYPEAIGFLKKALKLDPENSQAEDLMEKAEAGRKREETGRAPKAKDMQLQAKPKKP